MTKTINWGVLGAAKFALQHMAPAIHASRHARFAGLATSSEAKAEGFRAFNPDLKVYTDYDAMLADPAIDAVYIPLPNHLHVEWALKVLDAGKHMLVEKPLAMQADQFDKVIAKRDATGLVAAEAYMIVHHPQWKQAKALYEVGEIGDIVHVDAVFTYDNSADPGNIRNRPETGGGSLPDIGVYTFGSTRFVTGQEPETITMADITWENGVDVLARVAARFPGFSYTSVTSMRMHPRQDVAFHGTKGVIRLDAPFNANLFGEARVELEQGNQRRQWRYPADNHYVHQVEAFGAAIRGEAAYPCTLEFSKGTQAMIDAVFAKAKG